MATYLDNSLLSIKTLDDVESQRLDDIERVKREMRLASPDCPTELMSLLLARLTINSTFQFMGLLDCEGRALIPTYSAIRAVNAAPTEVAGKPLWETIWWKDLPDAQETLKDAVRRAVSGEFVRIDLDCLIGEDLNQRITQDFSLKPVRDKNGKVVFLVAEGRDVTEQRRLEREVARQREELAQLDQLKTQFFANISHEFRTPLALMLGPTEETLSELETAELTVQRERLETVRRNALRLQRMVNQLLDFSAIEANRICVTFQPTELPKLTAELASMFQSAVEKAGLRLKVNCSPLPEPVYVDRDMWEKIVLNLLSNAFKHTFQGEIEIGLQSIDHWVRLQVRDTGVGIPAEQLPKLFDRFQRVAGSRSRTHEGSGIGLALVQELVKLHGGYISVESVVNQGTTFTVEIPMGKIHLPPEQIHSSTELEHPAQAQPFLTEVHSWLPRVATGKRVFLAEDNTPWYKTASGVRVRVLLADDNADMRDYIERLLSPYCDVESVTDGEAALAAARCNPPDLILSDIMMPKMDGLQLLSSIRSDAILNTVPVVLVSARAGEEAKLEGLRMGANDYLIKPFDKRELLARVKANLNLELHRITEEAREAKRLSEARFKRMLDSNIIGVFFGHLRGGIISEANDYVLSMLGYTRDELLAGQLNWQKLTPPEQLPDDDARILELVTGKGVIEPFEKQYIHKDGHRVDILIGATVLENSKDDYICYVLDISERKKTEAHLVDYMQRLERSNKELEQFATVASHDLQEPLRKVMVFADHLKAVEGTGLSREADDDLERIQRAADKMRRLITDLLDLSRVIRRGEPFRIVDLDDVIRESVAELSYLYSGIRSRVKLSGEMSIEADVNQIRQMMIQLIDNALKFHLPGQQSSVEISIEPQGLKSCRITVKDNGIGIKVGHFDKIFDTFTRLHCQNYPGTGIGLTLVQKIVERHGGSIEVQSELNQGSTFVITLPVSHDTVPARMYSL